MELITIILTLTIVGLIVWLVITYIPMPQVFKTIIMVFAAIFVILWMARKLGLGL